MHPRSRASAYPHGEWSAVHHHRAWHADRSKTGKRLRKLPHLSASSLQERGLRSGQDNPSPLPHFRFGGTTAARFEDGCVQRCPLSCAHQIKTCIGPKRGSKRSKQLIVTCLVTRSAKFTDVPTFALRICLVAAHSCVAQRTHFQVLHLCETLTSHNLQHHNACSEAKQTCQHQKELPQDQKPLLLLLPLHTT